MIDNRKGRKRDLLQDKQIPVVDFCLESAREAEDAYERLLTIVANGVQVNAVQSEIGTTLYARFFSLYRRNDHMHDLMTMLRDNTLDIPLAEVDRILALRKRVNGVKKS